MLASGDPARQEMGEPGKNRPAPSRCAQARPTLGGTQRGDRHNRLAEQQQTNRRRRSGRDDHDGVVSAESVLHALRISGIDGPFLAIDEKFVLVLSRAERQDNRPDTAPLAIE